MDRVVSNVYGELGILPTLTAEMIPELRSDTTAGTDAVLARLAELGFERAEHSAAGFDQAAIPISSFTPPGVKEQRACIFYVHGGGMISGNRFSGLEQVAAWATMLNAVVVSPEYRLAPEYPDPHPVEDAYSAFAWVASSADALAIDPNRLVLVGASAGGGIAAGLALLARDRGARLPRAQMLLAPMLDDRGATVSAHQVDGVGFWDRATNEMAWGALLSDRRGTAGVSIYAAPARARNLGGLPPTFIDVGSTEVFRDEAVRFAAGIWEAGGVADLHVWAGGIHGYDSFAPEAAISSGTQQARENWLRRVLSI